MQVNRPSNIPGPLNTDRSNRDGQRRQQEGKEQGKQPPKEDAVEFQTPKDAKAGVAKPVLPKPASPSSGKQPPLDLSA